MYSYKSGSRFSTYYTLNMLQNEAYGKYRTLECEELLGVIFGRKQN
jgi:hypothetical protein